MFLKWYCLLWYDIDEISNRHGGAWQILWGSYLGHSQISAKGLQKKFYIQSPSSRADKMSNLHAVGFGHSGSNLWGYLFRECEEFWVHVTFPDDAVSESNFKSAHVSTWRSEYQICGVTGGDSKDNQQYHVPLQLHI